MILGAERGHLEVVRLLLEAGADKDAATQPGATALMFVAKNGHLEVVRLLLEAGADKDAATEPGATALMFAVRMATWKWCGCCSRLELTRTQQRNPEQLP